MELLMISCAFVLAVTETYNNYKLMEAIEKNNLEKLEEYKLKNQENEPIIL